LKLSRYGGKAFFIIIVIYFLQLAPLNKNTMGRGDKKTKKGKIFKGSFGKSRPADEKKITEAKPAEKKEG
jgi:30S ribosomal protein S31